MEKYIYALYENDESPEPVELVEVDVPYSEVAQTKFKEMGFSEEECALRNIQLLQITDSEEV